MIWRGKSEQIFLRTSLLCIVDFVTRFLSMVLLGILVFWGTFDTLLRIWKIGTSYERVSRHHRNFLVFGFGKGKVTHSLPHHLWQSFHIFSFVLIGRRCALTSQFRWSGINN